MKYTIYSKASQEWFRAPGQGLTKNPDDAHRFSRKEAEREMALRYNSRCEMHPVGETDAPNLERELERAHEEWATEALAYEGALRAILRDPHGCRFCDSGKLRNPEKGHDAECGYALAEAVLNPPHNQGGV